MSIVLSAAVRQNLLSLQSTADLLSTTQNRLATGKKVNSALDNPTNFFTAQGLDNRARDISNLLDGVSNGVQVLQAANTGITSIQKLVDSAKSVANQALQAAIGYSTKASATSGAITGATAADLKGTGLAAADVLTIAASGGAPKIDITFGDGTAGTVKTLDQLNTALGGYYTASISAEKITITTTNDYAGSDIALSGTATGATKAFLAASVTSVAKVADTASQTARANLVSQYNTILDQITKTAQDASFNGINLLNGDQLTLVFNENGKSKLNITGVTYNATGLGLANLTSGTDLLDNGSTNAILTKLSTAQSSLRSTASTFGSNLTIVQTRQDFSKNLINVLQTGSANLTLADTNEEAANSQALSTRQSIAVSALSLANQAQQAVLQLLR